MFRLRCCELSRQRYRLFFFSGRRRHTRSKRDWSSDVCSSDLVRRSRGGASRASAARSRAAALGERVGAARDRKSGGEGKRVDLGGRRNTKKKRHMAAERG